MSKNTLKRTKVGKEVNKSSSRKVHLKDIYNNLDTLSDNDIIDVKKYILDKKTVKVSKAKKVTKTAKNTKKEDIEDKQKVEIIIKVLNNMLRAVGLDEINDLIDFKIRRENLIDDKAVLSVESDFDTVFKSDVFTKKESAWYHRKTTRYYHVSFLKAIVNSTSNYEFTSEYQSSL